MNFTTPTNFEEAIRSLTGKRVMPTGLSSSELSKLSAQIREQSFFSARTLMEDYLDKAKAVVGSVLEPKQEAVPENVTPENPLGMTTVGFNPASARQELRMMLKEIGYQPDPKERGTIKDLSSSQRLDLVVETNVQMAQSHGQMIQGMADGVIDVWPAQELIRVEGRKQPRDWLMRFRTAGEQSGRSIGDGWTITPDGRMVALKGHPIWAQLGSSALFEDALDLPYPPFAFASGMDVTDVMRDEAIALGILAEDEKVQAQPVEFGVGGGA